MPIHPLDRGYFKQLSTQYLKYEEIVKRYIKERYRATDASPISVKSVCDGFQMVIGNIPPEVVTLWMEDEGYGIRRMNLSSSNYVVFLEIDKLEIPKMKANKKKTFNKGFIIY